MIVGLGTGSTVFYFVHALADKVKEGLNIQMVSTSPKRRHENEGPQTRDKVTEVGLTG